MRSIWRSDKEVSDLADELLMEAYAKAKGDDPSLKAKSFMDANRKKYVNIAYEQLKKEEEDKDARENLAAQKLNNLDMKKFVTELYELFSKHNIRGISTSDEDVFHIRLKNGATFVTSLSLDKEFYSPEEIAINTNDRGW